MKKTFSIVLLTGLLLFAGNVFGNYTGSGTFTQISSLASLTDGYYVVAYGTTQAMNNTNGSNNYFGNTAITPSAGVITNPASAIVWRIETNGGGRTIYNESSAVYVGYYGSSNLAYAVTTLNDSARWTFAWATSVFTSTNVKSSTRLLQYNTTSPRFACYTGSQQNLTLYKAPTSYLTYDGNGNTGGTAPAKEPYITGSSITLASNSGSLTKTGFIFGGWNTQADGNGTNYSAGGSYTISSSVTLYAKWIPTYSVTYNGNGNTGGSAPTDGSSPYTSGATVTVKSNTGSLVRTGYVFNGWNTAADGSGTSYSASGSATFTMPSSNVTLYAQWIPTYTVTYNGNSNTGGSAPTDGSSPYISGATVTVLNNTGSLVRTGYVFNGWNTTADGSGTNYSPGATFTITSNTILYAKWTASSGYTVTFIANGGSGSMSPQNASVPTALTTNTFTRTGYTFTGWNTVAGGGGTAYADGDIYSFSADITLYAQWSINSYTLSYNGNGHDGGTVNTGGTYNYNSSITLPSPTMTKTGYTFAGWNTQADGSGTNYTAGASYTMPATSTTLYAKWTINNYTITFNGNSPTSGTPSVASVSGNYNTNVTLATAGTLVKTGYTFAGWNTAADGSGTDYAAGSTYTNISSSFTLYAKWTINSYTVTFDGNSPTSGSPSVASVSGNYNTSVTLATIGTLVKTGYTFGGWNTASNGSGTTYTAGSTFTVPASNITLYAVWTPNNYTLTYNGNGSTGGSVPTGSPFTITFNATVTVLGNTGSLTKTGYTFSGWNTAADGSGTPYTVGNNFFMPATNVTLYAQWTVYVAPCESQDFESGTVPGTWTTGGGTTSVNGSSGDYYLNLNENGEYAQLPYGTNTYSSVSFNLKGSASSNSWTLYVQYSNDGSTWNNATTIAGSSIGTSYSLQTVTLPTASPYVRLYLTRTSNSCYIGNLDAYCVNCTAPTTQASSVSTNSPTSDGFSVAWTAGSGNGTMVVVRPTSSTNNTPSSGTSYTANLAWASAGQIDINNRVVFRNTGTSAGPITGLTAETQYTITAYEYNSTDNCYKLTTPPTTTRYTLSTEPTAHPTTGLSATTCTTNSIDLTVPAPANGADGYLVLMKAGSAPTGLPADATSYSVSNTIGDATIIAITTTAGTSTITGLTANTSYYFQLIPYNANAGAVAQTYNYLTSGTPLQTSFTTLTSGASTASTVETDGTYAYTQNILYASYQSTPIPVSAGSSVGVHNIIIKDGGGSADADALPTILTAISYSYTGTSNTIRAAALFTTSGSKVADGTVTANGISFSGMSGTNVTAADGGTTQLILRVTFNPTVTDNEKLIFTVTSVTGGTVCNYSQFAASNGGGAISDNNAGNDKNRIEVVADRIRFTTQPANQAINTNLATFTIKGVDINNNVDADAANSIALTTSGTGMTSSTPYSLNNGVVNISDVQFNTAQGPITLTATTTSLSFDNDDVSSNFYISAYNNGDYYSVTGTGLNWNVDANWMKVVSGSLSAPGAYAYPNSGTNIVYIQGEMSTNGSRAAQKVTITRNGKLSTLSGNMTADTILIKTGGTLQIGTLPVINALLEVEDSATVNYGYTNTSSRSTSLWNGVEKFHPKSNFVVQNAQNTSGFLIIQDKNDITPYTENSYSACFGNFIIDAPSSSNCPITLLPPGFVNNFTHGDLIFRNSPDDIKFADAGGNDTITIGGNISIESTYNKNISMSNSAISIVVNVKKNFTHNGTGSFRLCSSTTTTNSTVNIDSNLVVSNSGNLSFNASNGASHTSTLRVKGDVTIGTTGYITNASTSVKGTFSLNGTGDGTTNDKTQVVAISSTNAARNQYIDFTVGNGAYVQLGDTLELGNNSTITDSSGATLDFGFLGTTPQIISMVSGASGSPAFKSLQGSILKITSPDGLYKNWDSYSGITVNTGNVQGISKSNRSISPTATFWYIGKANQQTGDAPNAGLSGSGDAKVVICELANNSLTLTPTLSFGFTSTTTIDPTYGGHLYIKKGQFRETTSAYVIAGGGTLRMEPGTYYYIPKGNADLASADADPIPRMSGLIHPQSQYYLNGGTIELAGTGSSNAFQSLRGNTVNPKNYENVTFSGANTLGTDYKNLTSTVVIDSALTITGGAIVECHGLSLTTPQSFTGPGGLVMSGTNSRIRIRKLNVEQPELTGNKVDYSLTGGTVEFYGSGATQQQLMRGNYTASNGSTKQVDYFNLDINADAANWSTTSTFADAGNVNPVASFKLSGALNVNAPAVFRMDETDNVSNGSNISGGSQSFSVKDYAGLLYGSSNGIKTSGTSTSDGNIRISGTRNFSSNASYGFISSGDMTSGNGLPSTVKGIYVYKYNPADKVTLTNSVRADSLLKMNSGHLVTNSNRIELGVDVSNRGTLDYTAGYVVGNMRRWYNGTNSGNASGLFPLGENVSGTLRNRKYLIEFTSSPTTGGYLDVNFNHVDMGTAGLPINGIPAVGSCATFDVTTTEDEGYWIGTPQSGSLGDGNYTLSLTGENFSTITDMCQLTLLKRVGAGNWTAPGTHLQPTGSISVPTVSRSGISGFSNFGFGGGNPNPLPVELMSFSGNCVEDGISKISWSTASEMNSKYFIVQRSNDGVHYMDVTIVPASGFSNQPRYYSIYDTAANANNSYYRLVEVDNNKKQTIYSFIQVRCDETEETHIFYTEPKVVAEIISAKDKQVAFNIYEISGKLVHQENRQIARGYNRLDLGIKNKLPNGIYIIQLIDGEKVSSTKIMVH